MDGVSTLDSVSARNRYAPPSTTSVRPQNEIRGTGSNDDGDRAGTPGSASASDRVSWNAAKPRDSRAARRSSSARTVRSTSASRASNGAGPPLMIAPIDLPDFEAERDDEEEDGAE